MYGIFTFFSTRTRRHHRDVHHQVGRDLFDGLPQLADRDGIRQLHLRNRAEDVLARHRAVFAVGREFLDVRLLLREHERNLSYDAGPVLADHLDCRERISARRCRRVILVRTHRQPVGLQRVKRREQFRLALRRHLDAQDAGEMSAKMRHPAFEPVAAVFRDDG